MNTIDATKITNTIKIINTIEKPNVKSKIGTKLIFFFSINSFKELPET